MANVIETVERIREIIPTSSGWLPAAWRSRLSDRNHHDPLQRCDSSSHSL